MNTEMQLRLALAEIARLKNELAEADNDQSSWASHEKDLRAEFAEMRESDRKYHEERNREMMAFYTKNLSASNDIIKSLTDKVAALSAVIESLKLSEEDAKYLAKYNMRNKYKRSSEQRKR